MAGAAHLQRRYHLPSSRVKSHVYSVFSSLSALNTRHFPKIHELCVPQRFAFKIVIRIPTKFLARDQNGFHVVVILAPPPTWWARAARARVVNHEPMKVKPSLLPDHGSRLDIWSLFQLERE